MDPTSTPARLSSSLSRSLEIAEAHIRSEYASTDDLEAILETVSAEPRYVVGAPGSIVVIDTPHGVRRFYGEDREFLPLAWRPYAQIVGDGYVFYEGVGSRRNLETGEGYSLVNCVLLPIASDGIVGEFAWARPEMPAAGDPGAGPLLPVRALHNLHTFEQIVALIEAGRTSDTEELMASNCSLARHYPFVDSEDGPIVKAEGREGAAEWLRAWDATFERAKVTVLQRQVTDWYIFAECLITAKAQDGWKAVRTATIYGINESGELEGELSYALGVAPATGPSPGRGVGHEVFQRDGYEDISVRNASSQIMGAA